MARRKATTGVGLEELHGEQDQRTAGNLDFPCKDQGTPDRPAHPSTSGPVEPHGSVQTAESAEQPVVCSEQLHQNSARPPYDKVLDWLLNCTDEAPAEKLQIPRSEHPLSEQVVHNLAQADCDDEVASVVAELGDLFMF